MPIISDWHSYTDGQQGVAKSDKPLKAALKRTYEQALEESGGDHIAARQMFPAHIASNRRFDHLNAEVLADKFATAYDTGVRLDLEAPELTGGQPREQALKTSSVREGHVANTVKVWKYEV